jgi:pimeloyl-ACP methyl ester carboxylesterase
VISSRRTEWGHLQDTFPYVRVGDGPKPLLVVPGLGDAMFDGEYGPLAARGFQLYLRRFLDEYTVYVVSRPRGLAGDATIGDMSDDYARVLEEEVGPAAVAGLSMGGLIGQELAHRRPDLVDRLVVAVAGCRLGSDGEPIVSRLRGHALERDWVEIRARLLREMYTGTRRTVYPEIARTAGRLRPPEPAEPQDVVVSIEAVLEFDATDRLAGIEPSTLVIGGTDDVFFPEAVLRETKEGIPDAKLAMFPGARHGAFQEHKETFDGMVSDFLAGKPLRPAGSG